jgi:hypothetical protein
MHQIQALLWSDVCLSLYSQPESDLSLTYWIDLEFLWKICQRYLGSLGFVYSRLRKAKRLRLPPETESDLLYGEYADFIYDYIFFEDASHDSTLPITSTLL